MDFDSVLEEIGELGKFQLINYALLALPVMFGAANSLSYVFTAGIPDYRCYIQGCDDPTSPKYSEAWVSNAIPPQKSDGPYKASQCDLFSRSNASDTGECSTTDFSEVIERCDSWVYTSKETTIVNDWDITCFDKQWMLSLIGTLHFAGIVVGSGLFGFLADKFGRKRIFIFTILLMSLTGVIQAFSPDYYTFAVCTFLNALGTSGVFPLAFIIGVEMFGRKQREMSGIVLNYFYALGEAAVGLIAWLWPHWVIIQLVVSAPAFVFILYYWFIPESVRWLMAKQRNKRALKIIKKAARVNNVILSDLTLSNFQENSRALGKDMIESSEPDLISDDTDDEEPEKVKMMTLFLASVKSRIMVGRFFLLFYIWATNALVYYGLSLTSINMSGNKYLNFALVCLIEIPGYTLAWVSMKKGRRWSLTSSLFLCSVSCIGAAYTPIGYPWLSTILFLLGKLGITSSFGIVYVHTAELLPTGIRSAGVGVSSTLARVGAMMAPFVPLLGMYMEQLPLILFGLVAFIGSLCALILPETLGCRLPDTIEEAERIGHQDSAMDHERS